MKKIFISAALIGSAVAFAQSGKVGVNAATPQATLDIQPSAANANGTTNEGLLIPRLTKARVAAIAAGNLVEGTQVYVTDDVTAGDNATFTGTGKGFYYYDAAAARWVKMGAGTAAVTTAQNGLSMNGTAVELGGTLLKNTNIDQAGFNLTTTGTGNVGIGMSASGVAPGAKLHVLAPTNPNVSGLGIPTIVNRLELSGNALAGRGPVVGFYGPNGTGNGISNGLSERFLGTLGILETDATNGYMVFNVEGAGSVTEKMRIVGSTGNVGIGATNPAAKLDVQGNVRIGDVGAAASTSNQVLVRDTTTGIVGYRDASTLAGTSATTASNGLTATGSNVTLGGTLTQATTVDQANNNMTFTTGTGQFQVNGTTSLQGAYFTKITNMTTPTYTVQPNDYIIIGAMDGNQVITFPAADSTNVGRNLCIGKKGTGSLTVSPQPYGQTTAPANKESACYVSDGTVWFQISGY